MHDPNKFANTSMYDYLKANDAQFYLTRRSSTAPGFVIFLKAKTRAPPRCFFAPTWYAVAAGMVRKDYAKTLLKDAGGNLLSYDFKKETKTSPSMSADPSSSPTLLTKIYMRDAFPQGKKRRRRRHPAGRRDFHLPQRQQALGLPPADSLRQLLPISTSIPSSESNRVRMSTFTSPSTDNTVKNGVVHSLVDGFMIKELKNIRFYEKDSPLFLTLFLRPISTGCKDRYKVSYLKATPAQLPLNSLTIVQGLTEADIYEPEA